MKSKVNSYRNDRFENTANIAIKIEEQNKILREQEGNIKKFSKILEKHELQEIEYKDEIKEQNKIIEKQKVEITETKKALEDEKKRNDGIEKKIEDERKFYEEEKVKNRIERVIWLIFQSLNPINRKFK